MVLLVLIGCNNAFIEHVAEGDALLEAGKFDLALKSYEMTLEEKADSTEVKEKLALLESYEELQSLIDERKIEDAEKLMADLLANEYMIDSLPEAVEGLAKKIELVQTENEEVDGELDDIEKTTGEKRYQRS